MSGTTVSINTIEVLNTTEKWLLTDELSSLSLFGMQAQIIIETCSKHFPSLYLFISSELSCFGSICVTFICYNKSFILFDRLAVLFVYYIMTQSVVFHFVLSFGDGWPLFTLLVGKPYLAVPRMLGTYVVTFFVQCVLLVVVCETCDVDTKQRKLMENQSLLWNNVIAVLSVLNCLYDSGSSSVLREQKIQRPTFQRARSSYQAQRTRRWPALQT